MCICGSHLSAHASDVAEGASWTVVNPPRHLDVAARCEPAVGKDVRAHKGMWHEKRRMVSKWDIRLEAGRGGNASPRPVDQSPQELNIRVRAKSADDKGGANTCRAPRQPVQAARQTARSKPRPRMHGRARHMAMARACSRDVSLPRPALTGVNSGAGDWVQGGTHMRSGQCLPNRTPLRAAPHQMAACAKSHRMRNPPTTTQPRD